ncbi:amino acid oxidase [Amycolatopsis antarctica]|uniref:D-amino-acid oxidase n=1 Tax=Amycolatopsis antarctica TaxID=1854586 RepID=A0A263D4L1_9PSEU|nr:amino acid oxidase [Amycolatopsis antarctica]
MLVVGAGVIGLTAAVCLAEAGHDVRVRAELLPEETTSAVASGLWTPGADVRELAWSRVTYDELMRLDGVAGTGVHVEAGLEVSDLTDGPLEWAADLPEYRLLTAAELPPGMRTGLWTRAPMIDLPPYLRYLTRRLATAGTEIERAVVRDLRAAVAEAEVVVHCAGLAAGGLAGDPDVVPVRGQHVVVRNPGIGHFYIEAVADADWTGFFPHGDRLVLAGTSHLGDRNPEPDPVVARGILDRCARAEPRLAGAEVLAHQVGLRPARPAVRLDVETYASGRIVHCYGHGGSGVSLSWGCAREVVRLVG